MGRVLMARELSTSQLISMRDSIKAQLLAYAVKESGKNASEFIVRDALPLTDFGFTTEAWVNQAVQTVSTWTKDWSKELPKSKFVMFYGAINHSDAPTIILAKFAVGANGQTVKDIVDLGRMKAEDVVKCYFEPIMYKGGDTIHVSLYPDTTIAIRTEPLQWLVFVAEPYGEVISGPAK